MRIIILSILLCNIVFSPVALDADVVGYIAPESELAQEELDLRALVDQIKERGRFGPLTPDERERAEAELSDALHKFTLLLPEGNRPTSLLEFAPKIKTTNAFSKYRVENGLPLTIVFDGSIYSLPPYSENVWRIAYTHDSQFDALTVICSKVANEKFIVGLAGVRYYDPKDEAEYKAWHAGLLQEAVILADTMDRKGFLWDDPFDGGQVTILPHPETKDHKQEILERWAKSSVDTGLLGKRFVVKPGLGTGEEEMNYVQEAALLAKEALEVAGFGIGETLKPFATSRPLKKGGWPHIEWQLTGRGMVEGIITVIGMLKKYRDEVPEFGIGPDEELSVIIQGFGDIGAAVADLLLQNAPEYKIKVVGVSDKDGAIYDPKGLDRELLNRIRDTRAQVTSYPKEAFSKEGGVLKNRDDLPFQKATIFVPASVGNVITRDNYKRLKAKIIIEGADVAVAPEVAGPLQDEMYIVYYSGLGANAGGLCGAFEEVFHSLVETVLETQKDIKEHLFHMIDSNAISVAKLLMRRWIASQKEGRNQTPLDLVNDLTENIRTRRDELLSKPTEAVIERAEIEAIRNVPERLAMLIAACDEARHEVFFNKGMTTEELMRDLDSVDIYEQRDAARFLGERRELAAVEALIDILRDRGRDPRVRRNAAEALGNMAAEEALGLLLEVADDKGEVSEIRDQARWSLERMVADVDTYREAMKGRTLEKIPKENMSPELVRGLASEILSIWYKNSTRRKPRPTIIAITGYAATGKTHFASELAFEIRALLPGYILGKGIKGRIADAEVLHIDFDNYLLAKGDRPSQLHTLGKIIADKIETWIGKWEFPRFFSDIRKLHEGRPIDMPLFDQVSRRRKKETEPIIPRNNIIIVEGIFIMTDEGANKFYDRKIFLDASNKVRTDREIERYLAEGKYNNITVKELWDKVRRKEAAENLPIIQHERLFANIIISTDNIPVREFVRAFGEVAVRGYWDWRRQEEEAHPGIGLSLVEQEGRLRYLFGDVGFDRIRGSDLEEKVWTRLCQNTLVPEKTSLFYAVAELVAEQFKKDWPGKGVAERQKFLQGLRERFKLDEEDFRILEFSALAPSRLLEENVQPRRDASTSLLAPQTKWTKWGQTPIIWRTLLEMKAHGEKIAMLTGYDAHDGWLLTKEGIDAILVGDSVANVRAGFKDTRRATMKMMLYHTQLVARGIKRAVRKGSRRPLLIGDMPINSYKTPEKALENARRFMEIKGVGAIKLEGGKEVVHIVKYLVDNGIPVMGHIGHTPQTAKEPQVWGATSEEILGLMEDAKALEEAGAFAIVMELVDANLSREITGLLKVPTIGIGAGRWTDGQVLVSDDMWGESEIKRWFVRVFAVTGAGGGILGAKRFAVERYIRAVKAGEFPDETESRYVGSEEMILSCL